MYWGEAMQGQPSCLLLIAPLLCGVAAHQPPMAFPARLFSLRPISGPAVGGTVLTFSVSTLCQHLLAACQFADSVMESKHPLGRFAATTPMASSLALHPLLRPGTSAPWSLASTMGTPSPPTATASHTTTRPSCALREPELGTGRGRYAGDSHRVQLCASR